MPSFSLDVCQWNIRFPRTAWLAKASECGHHKRCFGTFAEHRTMATIDMHQVVGRANILFITFDCLRFDVARRCLAEGTTPQLARLLPADGWEPRETPGTFTLAAHLAFFHGFLPTPPGDATHPRLFALEFEGSLTIGPGTYTFAGVDNILAGFRRLGYRTFCVGGVGFFNKRQGEQTRHGIAPMAVVPKIVSAATQSWALQHLARSAHKCLGAETILGTTASRPRPPATPAFPAVSLQKRQRW
jgi:hypothetical protein